MSRDFKVKAAPGQSGMMVKTVLRRSSGVSTRLIRRVAHGDGALFLNGKPAKFIDKVVDGDEITLVMPEEKSDFTAEAIPVDIMYEDDHLILLDKVPGIVVHPTKGHVGHTVANAIQHHMEQTGESYKIRFVNRLDMDTSGVLLVGKTSLAQSDFSQRVAAGLVTKEYLAIVTGDLRGTGVVDAPIALFEEGSPRRMVAEGGYPSKTEYVSEKNFTVGGDRYSLVRLRLHTGRTHQIRVHLAHIGHPVLADHLYGSPSELIERQALHSHILSFPHPITGKQLEFMAGLHDDMMKLLPDEWIGNMKG
ncbi:MAG: RluA family pseudouridine synthase [Clostridiales Family XIII bacterium]|jgi:23S rRNA pseudouridine1911/1915/1917 synthase|nr:RluA family pseudouridine synthase [Clostridiales Family XIII bacterium]